MRSPLSALQDLGEPLALPRAHLPDFLAVLAVLIVARWQALVQFTFSVDDYQTVLVGQSAEQLIGQGRIGAYWIDQVSQTIGFDPVRTPILTIGLSCAIAAWIAVRVIRLWTPNLPRAALIPAAVLAMAHPYTSELFTFRSVTLYHYMAYGAATAALLLSARPNPARVVAATVALAAALSVYQVALNFFIVLAVFTLVFDLHHRLRGASGPAQVPDPWRGFAATVGTAIAAAALYFLLASATQGSGHVDARASTIELNQVNERFNLLFNVLQSHFILESAFPGALVPPHLRFALWALLLAAIAAPLLDRDRPLAVRLGGSVSLVVAAFCGLVFSVGILLVSKILWLPPRVFMPVGLVWAAVFLFVSMWSGPRLRFGSLLVAWIIAFGFVAKHQQIFVDQWRVNMRDRAAVQAMVARLQQNHSWPEVTHVTVLGGAWNFESGIPTAAGNQSISAFSQPWSIPAMFTEVTGRKFSAPTPKQRAVAVEFCDTAAPRRTEFKTAILDNLAVVCVGPI